MNRLSFSIHLQSTNVQLQHMLQILFDIVSSNYHPPRIKELPLLRQRHRPQRIHRFEVPAQHPLIYRV